jgi:CheY-like chemotaxis protein
MSEMTLYCKSKLLCEYPQYYDNNKGVLFSPSPRSFYLPFYKLLYGSVSSSFERINSLKSGVTTTNTAAQFSDSIPTNSEHILLVDDEEDIARLFKRALERAGFIVDMYNDPLQSLSNYRTGVYDLLLLDIKMPEMNGFELYKRIKQIDDNSKVCFMTAFEEYYDEFREIFPDLKDKECFIRKPISINDLIKSVKSHLNYPRNAQ